MLNPATASHRWRFFRAGGFDQVKLETGADLVNLDQLDPKLWVALACPTTGLEFDPKTLALIDTDKDGRIRAPELIAAARWAGSMLKDPDLLVRGGDSIPLSAIDDSTPEGRRLLASARQILINLGRKDAAAISLADASDANRIFADTTFNGDGVIIAESAADEATRALINDIAACLGTVPDRSGKPGIDQARANAFFAGCAALGGWRKLAEADAGTILPAGPGTAAAAAAVRAIRGKVDDYFGRCRLAAFDPRTTALLNRGEEDYLAVAAKDLSFTAAEVAGFPLARIVAGQPLPLQGTINPAHAAAVAELRISAVKPLLGDKTELIEADWVALQARLDAFERWNAGKAGEVVERLGIQRVREILASKARETVDGLIAKDKALEPEAASIANVEKIVRFVRDLHTLCINFVNFRNFYGGGHPAVFQCGTLYLDQRSCSLCLIVEDSARHATMAGLAGAYLAYCDCVRKGTGEKMSILAVFSQGDDDNLMVGRNGIFFDRKGLDYDATITRIVSNPIGVRQAFWLPYKKFVRMVEEIVSKRAAVAEPATAKAAEPRKIDVGTVAALGVAFGSIATFLGLLIGHLIGIVTYGPLAILGLIIGVMALISGPSMILAYIKLHKRNLGPILDANGWAVNAKAKINVPFGAALTGIAKLPAGSDRDLIDPFAEKKSPWPKLAVFALALYLVYVLLNHLGFVYQWTNGRMGIQKRTEARNGAQNAASPAAVAAAPAATNAPPGKGSP
jgi:hypothetical protein